MSRFSDFFSNLFGRHRNPQPDKPQTKPALVATPPSPAPEPEPPPKQVVPSGPKFYGYFWNDAAQTGETADHVNIMQLPCAGIEWFDTPEKRQGMNGETVARMLAARDAGIAHVLLCVDNCGFEMRGGHINYVGDAEARTRLAALHTAIGDADLFAMVAALYTIDEPNGDVDVVEADLIAFCAQCKWVFGVPLATMYGNYGRATKNGSFYRALEAHDWVGEDAYGEGAGFMGGTLDNLLTRMRVDQRVILMPGCSSQVGWQEPRPWLERALNDPRVVALMPFGWSVDGGLRTRPDLQPPYRAAGQAIKSFNGA